MSEEGAPSHRRNGSTGKFLKPVSGQKVLKKIPGIDGTPQQNLDALSVD